MHGTAFPAHVAGWPRSMSCWRRILRCNPLCYDAPELAIAIVLKGGVMFGKVVVAGLALLCSSTSVIAAEYLSSITSEVFQTSGTSKEIAARANTCISQHLTTGTADDPLIVSSDLDGGIIVARNSLEYGSLPRWKIRSRFTFEAREGRFRIEQSNLERFNMNMFTGVESWGAIGKWSGSRWKEVTARFEQSATAVAQCVISAPGKRDDW